MYPVYAPIDDDYDLSDISPGNSVNSEKCYYNARHRI